MYFKPIQEVELGWWCLYQEHKDSSNKTQNMEGWKYLIFISDSACFLKLMLPIFLKIIIIENFGIIVVWKF